MTRYIFILTLFALCTFWASAQKVFMIGDSHVAGKFYPDTLEATLKERYPDVEFGYFGKNGAGFYTYNDSLSYQQLIFDAEPDILIIHLGTNDSYSAKFDASKFTEDVERFYTTVSERLPQCQLVFVTPFDNKLKHKTRARGRRRYTTTRTFNNSTRLCCDAMVSFVETHDNTYVIDNNADHGKEFLNNSKLMRADFVHLTPEGYGVLARQVAEELVELPGLFEEYIPDGETYAFDESVD